MRKITIAFAMTCMILLFATCGSGTASIVDANTNLNGLVNGNPLKELVNSSSVFESNTAGEYFVFLTLQGHDIQVGDEIDGIHANGKRITIRITKVVVDNSTVQKLQTGQQGGLDFKVIQGNIFDLGGDYYLVDKGGNYPGGAVANDNAATEPAVLTCNLNGTAWSGIVASEGALYYEKGLSLMDPSGKPYLQLAFRSKQGPDDRQLTIQVKDFKAVTGRIDGRKTEVLFSGSATGDRNNPSLVAFKDETSYASYEFEMNVIKWEAQGPEKANMSANFVARLKGLAGAQDVEMSAGKITDLSVKIFKDPR